jgi:hypothetical protein
MSSLYAEEEYRDTRESDEDQEAASAESGRWYEDGEYK